MGIVIEAALSGPAPRFEEMLTLALVSRENAAQFEESNKEALRQADQDEIDELSYEMLNDDLISAFAPSDAGLESIVRMRRKREGWRWLIEEGRPPVLRRFWAAVIRPDATPEELAAIEQVFRHEERWYYLQAVANAQRHELVPRLLSEFPSMEGKALDRCIDEVSKLNHEDWDRVIPNAVAQMPWTRRATLIHFRHPPMPGKEAQEWMPGAFSSDEREALALCEAAAKGSLGAPTASARTTELLKELAQFAEPHLAGLAVVALSSLKEEITSFLARLETSGERVARLAALVAQHFAGCAKLTDKLKAALRDPHYRIRAAAVDMLAAIADGNARALVLELAKQDPSASVRRVGAAVIARERWSEGESVLVELLSDRHNYGSPNEDGPDYRVARTAAEGLRSMRPLTNNTVDRIYDILTGKGPRQEDILVLYPLIFSLAGQSDTRVVPLLTSSLRSRWYVAAYRDSGYPLRYAAGWALWHHLNDRSGDVKLVDPKALAGAATHDDDRLAAPAMLVLGKLQDNALLQLREVLDAPTFTPERGLLLAMSLPPGASASRAELQPLVGASDPAWEFLGLAPAVRPQYQTAWREYLSKHPGFFEWLRNIQSDDGLFPTLRFVLRMLLKFDDPEELPSSNPFGDHYPQCPQRVMLGTFVIRD